MTKVWDDEADRDGKRAGVKAAVTLMKTLDGTTEDIETVSVGTEDGWSKTWEDLPIYEGGQAITWSVKETDDRTPPESVSSNE